MDYAEPCYDYNDWILLYMQNMWRYALNTNYIHLINNNKNKGATIYIDGRHKAYGNTVGFINIT